MTSEVKTLLVAESKPQIDEVQEFLTTLDQNGQRSLLDFLQGARFMQGLMTVRAGGRAREEGEAYGCKNLQEVIYQPHRGT